MRDLFAGLEAHTIKGDGADIYLRRGGNGPPLLLLHGYPETHMIWHRIAGELAKHFTLYIPDLRGYGRSSKPQNTADNMTYSKRSMGADLLKVMDHFGHAEFMICGHDRGARCAYRMALDAPQRVAKLCVLDIIPTYDMWRGMDHKMAMNTYHWPFLAQPFPVPETLIGKAADFYLESLLVSWSGGDDLSVFDPLALEDYRHHFGQPETIHATCNDYRAGETCDYAIDHADLEAGCKIKCPVLVLWGEKGIPSDGGSDTLAIWRRWADQVSGHAIDCGHFIPEENPADCLKSLLPFLQEHAG